MSIVEDWCCGTPCTADMLLQAFSGMNIKHGSSRRAQPKGSDASRAACVAPVRYLDLQVQGREPVFLPAATHPCTESASQRSPVQIGCARKFILHSLQSKSRIKRPL